MFLTLSSHWSEPTQAVQMFVFLSLEEIIIWKYRKGSYYCNILGRIFKYKIKIGHRSNTPPSPPQDYMYLITHQ